MTTNHPAHGPVSLERLHQIREILSKAAAQRDGGNLGYAMADAVKVIDEVLNAEPVLYAAEETLAYAKMGELHLKCLSQPMGDAVIPLYTAPPAPVVPEYPETLPCPVLLEPGMRFGKGVKTRLVLEAIQRRAEHYAELEAMTPEQRAEHDAGIEAIKAMLPKPAQPDIEMLASALTNAPLAPSDSQGRQRAPVVPDIDTIALNTARNVMCDINRMEGWPGGDVQLLAHIQSRIEQACRAAMLQAGNSPESPDGYVLVPKEITCAMDDAAWEAYHETRCMSDIWAALLAVAPKQEAE
ncbi:hypothetical protein [Citrobacter freundii]|uniref:hypothetical protein n=1 Tax=Citrobacter freundii TaxID=546 RepID=UPI003979EE04